MDVKRCLDTYALMEISQENPDFEVYLDSDFVITEITLVEFYGVILRNYNEQTADYWFRKLEGYAVSVNREILKEAVKFKHENKKTNISFFDAAGYIFSIKNGCYFVTGDKEFKDFKNVEFIQK